MLCVSDLKSPTTDRLIVRIYDPVSDVTTYLNVYQIESIAGETILFADTDNPQREEDQGTTQMTEGGVN